MQHRGPLSAALHVESRGVPRDTRRESGVPISIHFFQVCTIRDGKVRRIEYFRHRVDALEAAGLRE